jgi:hypothetical protein
MNSKDINLVFQWLEIRAQSGWEFPYDVQSFKIAARKSCLLERLLSGKQPLDIPPPRSYSNPWYELIEDGVGYPYEVQVLESSRFIVIDQTWWYIEETLGPDNWYVTYDYPEYKTLKKSPHIWNLTCTGYKEEIPLSSLDKFWELKFVR